MSCLLQSWRDTATRSNTIAATVASRFVHLSIKRRAVDRATSFRGLALRIVERLESRLQACTELSQLAFRHVRPEASVQLFGLSAIGCLVCGVAMLPLNKIQQIVRNVPSLLDPWQDRPNTRNGSGVVSSSQWAWKSCQTARCTAERTAMYQRKNLNYTIGPV
jgi:hypothetical protein